MTFEEWRKAHLTMDGYPQYSAEDAWNASRRSALEEAAQFMESRALAMQNGTHIGGTMARIYREEADAIRQIANGETE